MVDPAAKPAKTQGGQDINNSISEPHAELRPRPWKGSKKKNTKVFFLKVPVLVHRPTAAAVAGGNCRLMALQTSYQKSDNTLKQSAFIFVLIRKPADVYNHV